MTRKFLRGRIPQDRQRQKPLSCAGNMNAGLEELMPMCTLEHCCTLINPAPNENCLKA